MPPLVVIVGETASGKSALAMELAEQFHGEIICADSWTVYRGFDIGTAKPSAEDQQHIKHHLLDIVDAPDGFSAAIFKGKAQEAITDITSRGSIPFLVGGTGLYIDSVVFDYGFLPPPPTELRDRLNKLSIDELLLEANKLELNTSAIDTRNKRRIIRLIENNGLQPTKASMRPNTLLIGIQIPTIDLEQRITRRVDAMLKQGLEHEAKQLAEYYGFDVEPMKGIGYREWEAYFSGAQTLGETRQRIIKATLSLAKRQRTWFKRNKSIHWLSNPRGAVDLVTTFLNTLP